MFIDRILKFRDYCQICLDNKVEDDLICLDCLEQIKPIHQKRFKKTPYIDEVYYTSLYTRFNREILRNYKFKDKSYLYKPIGDLMLETIYKYNLENKVDLIIPVPLHKSRYKSRGYNQSDLLARYIGKKLNLKFYNNILIKIKNTPPQSSLDLFEREENLKRAYRVENPFLINGKSILLIDDLFTTGNTVSNCGKELRKSGGNEIIVLTYVSAKNE